MRSKKAQIAFASLLLGLCACSKAGETEDDGRFQKEQAQRYQIRNDRILQRCLNGSAILSERLSWDQNKYNISDYDMQKLLKVYSLDLHDRVKKTYIYYNKLIDDYKELISKKTGMSKNSKNYRKIISIISLAEYQIEEAHNLNEENRKKKNVAESQLEFAPTDDDLKISGVGVNLDELKISTLYLKYLYDSNMKEFISQMNGTISKDIEYFGNNDIKTGRKIPRIGSPEPVYYAMMLYYAGQDDLKSSWRVASDLLTSRVDYVRSLAYSPISELLEKHQGGVEWSAIVRAIDPSKFEKNWICSPLFDVSADWLSLVKDAANENHDKKLTSDVKVWTSALMKVSETRPRQEPWMSVIQHLSRLR